MSGGSFLGGVDARRGRWRDAALEVSGVFARYFWTGRGRDALEVAYATAASRPNAARVRGVWKQRHGRAAAPLFVVVAYPKEQPKRATVCGPAGEDPPVVELDHDHAERLARAALAEPDRHVAIRYLASALEGDPGEHPGLRNRGLLATHELLHGVPARPDWVEATTRSRPMLGLRGYDLVRGLGYEIEPRARHSVLRAGGGQAQAVAVFLNEDEQPDQTSARFGNQTPATYALAHADRDRLPWVVAVRGGVIRLYSTATSGAAGQRGRTETFVELGLPLLPSERAGYLHLLFSADALADGGSMEEIRRASSIYTSGLSERLRERVYKEVVPRLSVAVARRLGGTDRSDLERHYRTALTILFRLMFVAYAEDSRLLPLHVNGEYADHALKTVARRLADRMNAGENLGFDNPLTREYNNKGVALRALADLLARLSRHEEAERTYWDAVTTLDQALSRAPDDIFAYNNKGGALQSLGKLLVSLSRYEEAERAYADAVAALDEALGRAPDYLEAYRNKGNALFALGNLLAGSFRYEDAEGAFSDAAAAFDAVLSCISGDTDVHFLKAVTLVSQGEAVRVLGAQGHVVRALWEEAQSHAEHILSLVPRDEDAVSLLAQIRHLFDTLDDSSQGK